MKVPNLSNADRDTCAMWVAYLVAARPEVDMLRLLLAAPGVTVGDVLDNPTAFDADD